MEHDDYLQRMKANYFFRSFKIEPKWVPDTQDIEGFCHDEVIRQGHDPRVEHDGGVRVRGMMSAWWYAQQQSEGGGLPGMSDILSLGKYVEPTVNSTNGFRLQNVYIGDNTGAPPGLINEMVTHLVIAVQNVTPEQGRVGPHAEQYRALWKYDIANDSIMNKFARLTHEIVTADDWYLCYEAIHPFGDGNGRSGKVLHNWLLGTLDDPVLVADYFGGGNP